MDPVTNSFSPARILPEGKHMSKTYLKLFKPNFSSLMGHVRPLQPLTMALNQEVIKEGNRSQSDCYLCDSTRVTAHVSSSSLGCTSQDASVILRIQ